MNSSNQESGYNWEFIWEMIDLGYVFVCHAGGECSYKFEDDVQA